MADVDINKFRASVVRDGSKPASPGFIVSEGQSPTDPAGSGQNHLPVTIAETATGLSITESQVLGGAGTVGQYIRGDGSLADFPESSGGGSSISYYLNGSVSQGTIGGVAYKELNKVPILGAGTDFTINADGYIASFLTDAGDPNLLEIPGGNWNFETYFSASSSGGTPTFYVELYKVNSGGTATLIASNSTFPELIAFGTNIISYFSTLAVPTTALALTDRLAIRYYVTHSGRTITLHTEDNHLCQIVTTFTTGITALNGLTAQVQNFAVGTSGTDFAISSATATHTFNLPTASATNRGALSSADWSIFNGKQNALTNPVTGTGTTNYLPKFTGASTIGNSVIQESGGLIGIGSTPSYLLNVISLTDASLLEIKSTATANNTALRIGIDGNNAFINATGGSTGILEFRTYGSSKAIITQTGNVLIGNPPAADNGARLQVSGEGKFYQPLTNTTSYLTVENNRARNAAIRLKTTVGDFLVGVGIGADTNQFQIYDNTAGATRLTISSTGAATFSASVTSNSGDFFATDGTRTNFFGVGTGANVGYLGTTTNHSLAFLTNNTEKMRITTGGDVYLNNAAALFFGPTSVTYLTGSTTNMVFAVNTGERMRITSGGNVLIGTTTDSGDKLQVNGAIKTSAPSGGTAGSWKFGTASSGSFTVGGRVRIEINGVAYDILTT